MRMSGRGRDAACAGLSVRRRVELLSGSSLAGGALALALSVGNPQVAVAACTVTAVATVNNITCDTTTTTNTAYPANTLTTEFITGPTCRVSELSMPRPFSPIRGIR